MILHAQRMCLLLAAAIMLSGCASSGSQARSASDLYDQLHLTYCIPAQKLEMTDEVASGDSNWRGAWISDDDSTSTRMCCLQIAYPHPERGKDFAQAVLITQAAVTSPGGDWDQGTQAVAWIRDVRKRDLDRALTKLRSEEFFQYQGHTSSDVQVVVNIDGHARAREWLQNDVLDEIVWFARGQGEKIDLSQLPAFAQRQPASSVLAYRNAIEREAAPRPAVSSTPNRPATGSDASQKLVRRLPAPPPVRTAWR